MSNLVIALEITLVGMGLVFAALILLWWMMALLTSLTQDKEPASHPAEPSNQRFDKAPPLSAPTQGRPASVIENEEKARVAALAVAFALAQEEIALARPLSDPPTALVSAWQLGMRTKQLYQKGERVKQQFRKIG